MTLRLRFWLLMMDMLGVAVRMSGRAYSYACTKAGDATDWGEGAKLGDEEPF